MPAKGTGHRGGATWCAPRSPPYCAYCRGPDGAASHVAAARPPFPTTCLSSVHPPLALTTHSCHLPPHIPPPPPGARTGQRRMWQQRASVSDDLRMNRTMARTVRSENRRLMEEAESLNRSVS